MLLNIQKNGEETVSGGSVTGDGPGWAQCARKKQVSCAATL